MCCKSEQDWISIRTEAKVMRSLGVSRHFNISCRQLCRCECHWLYFGLFCIKQAIVEENVIKNTTLFQATLAQPPRCETVSRQPGGKRRKDALETLHRRRGERCRSRRVSERHHTDTERALTVLASALLLSRPGISAQQSPLHRPGPDLCSPHGPRWEYGQCLRLEPFVSVA